MYKKHYSVDRLLKNVNVLQVGTGKNPTTLIVKQKIENFMNKKNTKITKREQGFCKYL